MKYVFYVVLSFILASCQFFETNKISSETFYEEELKTINWNEVDRFPAFTSCLDISEKKASEQCFVRTLSQKIHASIQAIPLIANTVIKDTIWLDMAVSEKGKIYIKAMKVDSVTTKLFPKFTLSIRQHLDSLPTVAPAYKRGIPVAIVCKLPIILETKNL